MGIYMLVTLKCIKVTIDYYNSNVMIENIQFGKILNYSEITIR